MKQGKNKSPAFYMGGMGFCQKVYIIIGKGVE
jgi:hypothetical protein